MPIEVNNKSRSADFIRLNEQWIREHFRIEDADRRLFSNPYSIVEEGGLIFTQIENDRVVGTCALLKDTDNRYQLARMAVDVSERGKGHGETLLIAALSTARKLGARSVYLLSNTCLAPAIALYRKHGFIVVSEGPHPAYERCDIVMEHVF